MIGETLFQDARVGLRVLAKEKSFCALAIGVLALGICAVTTQFTVINAVLLRGFSFPHPEQLVDVAIGDPVGFAQGGFPNTAMPDFEDAVKQQHSFAQLASYINLSTINTTIGGDARRHTGAYVSDKFFSLLGVSPILGRDFTAADNRPGAERAVIIGYDMWRADFAGDPAVVGRPVNLNGRAATVIGVMPAGFKFPFAEELWVPLYTEFPLKRRDDPTALTVAIIGRLNPGVSIDQANLEFTTIARRLALENPKTNQTLTQAGVRPLIRGLIGSQIRKTLYGMLFAVAAVLLIACVNVMNMQLARATLRSKELAIRGALGASRLRLIRQMLTESLLVATAGAALGVLLSEWAITLLVHAVQGLSFPLPYWIRFTVDTPVLVFTVAVTFLTALASGLLPAVIVSRANPALLMKEGGRGNSSRLINVLTGGLVVAQIALTSALLVGCSLQIKSVKLQQTVNFGYDEGAVYSARMGLFQADYPTARARSAFYDQLLRSVRSDPAVGAAALTTRFQMLFDQGAQLEVEGKTYVQDSDRPQCFTEQVSDGYFETLGIPLLEGRAFNADDDDGKRPVAIINATLARKYFGREDPIGREIRIYRPGLAQDPWRTIIGVAPDTRMQGPFANGTGEYIEEGFFVPLHGPLVPQFMTVLTRPRGGPPDALQAGLRRDVQRADPNLPIYFPGTPHELRLAALGQNRIVASLLTAFGAVAALLSAVGLYGVMSFSVNQRTTEFGIRMALGAQPADILRIVLRQGGVQLVAGLSIGLGSAVALILMAGATQLAAVLPFVSPRDPLIYGGVTAILTAVALVSCLGPANRATRVQPMIALRAE